MRTSNLRLMSRADAVHIIMAYVVVQMGVRSVATGYLAQPVDVIDIIYSDFVILFLHYFQ